MSYEVEVKELKAQPFIGIREKTTPTPEGIAATCTQILPEAWKYATENGGKPAGPPMVLYHTWSDTETEVEGGLTLQEPIQGNDRVQTSELPAGKAAVLRHVGPYDKLGEAHNALHQWMEANSVTPTGPRWEVYITDPQENPDPSTWVTEVYQAV